MVRCKNKIQRNAARADDNVGREKNIRAIINVNHIDRENREASRKLITASRYAFTRENDTLDKDITPANIFKRTCYYTRAV